MTIDSIANGIEQPNCGTLLYEPAGTTAVKTEGSSGPAAPDRRRCNLINGYQIIARIGAGGYGEVWRAQAPGGLAKAVKFVYGLADEKRASDEWKAGVQERVVVDSAGDNECVLAPTARNR